MAFEPQPDPALPAGEPDEGFPAAPGGVDAEGHNPWYLAYRRLRRNRLALASLALFGLIVVFVLAAPLWATHVAHTGPNTTHTTEKITVDGEKREVVDVEGKPIGPVWFGAGGRFFLGADGGLGRDEMVRLMYGGRTSLFIGLTSALITTILATILGLLAGYYKGWTDGIITRTLDVIWSFPVVLLGIALGTALAVGGLKIGPLELSGNSIWIPILIIAVVYTPYMARPIRGEVLAMREKEFVESAVAQGAGSLRIMFGELLPNLWSTVIVFFTLNIANNMLLEASLSFLGAGVQAPNSSWGKMVSLGAESIYTSPLLAFAPGILILLTVLSLNVFGDGLRDALDPRSKVRLTRAEAAESAAGGAI
ncbi:MAG TPA: ABC transporter permease [Solirubrobacterales bacterium]|nr:ABC transporter permease [Solirubrobacterales bacterium]